MKWIRLTLVGTCMLTGCAQRENDSLTMAEGIEGDWRWLYGYGGHLEDTTRTLGSSSNVLTIANGDFRLVESNGSVTEGTYVLLDEGTAARGNRTGPLLSLSAQPPLLMETEWIIEIRGDTLTLMSLVDDDFDHTFLKRRR